MSLILKFVDAEARARFISRLEREKPDLAKGARASKSNVNVVTVSTAGSQDDASLRELAEPGTKVYDDVQFETF